MKSAVEKAVSPAEGSGSAPAQVGESDSPRDHTQSGADMRRRRAGAVWRVLAVGTAIVLAGLTVATILLITRKPSTVDQLVIMTVPSGADVRINAKDYGHSPVKIEHMPTGTYTLEITKEGFSPVVEQMVISESQWLERKLATLPPSGNPGLSAEERIARYQTAAQEAFSRRRFGAPYPDGALYYADLIIDLDQSNEFALDMRERVRRALHQAARTALQRGDSAQALEAYEFLADNFADDEDARLAKAKLESQLAARRGELRDLLQKASEALLAGNLTEPARSSAYYYSKQVLAIDRQNAQARALRDQVKEKLKVGCEKAIARGDVENAFKECEQIIQLFPEDKQIRAQLNEMREQREAEVAKAADPELRRVQGLAKYRRDEYAEAVGDLEFAMVNGRGTAEVIFSLAQSLFKLGRLDEAATYFGRVPPTAGDPYTSAIAALGDIALQRGDSLRAVARYKEARQLGGSGIYPVAILDDKIESIARKQREKAAEPLPFTIQVKHPHGRLRGSCHGTLTVSPTGVRYEGSEHHFSSNVVGVGVAIAKDILTVRFQADSQKFTVTSQQDGERFRDALVRYQQAYSPATK